ncbi:centromere protein P isoform X4 [Notamacropus eugenii]|uniref:centromere protein P isoform X4 n=1 Tax=Notamacropus eugenii TaxID=9315 RepID=UPI003B66FBA6
MALEQQRLELRALRAEIAPLEAQLGRSESGLSFLSRLTGVRITEYCVTRSSERARNGGLRVLRKGHLAGDCCAGINISFQLEFQLLETQSEETFTVAITDLSIILEPVENKELSRFVARTEEKRDLFLFFRSLYFFQEWCEYRKRTFHYFKEKHPKVVQLPEGPAADAMVLQSPSVPGFELMVVWRVHVDEEGKVMPELDLLTKIPEQALSLDKKNVVTQAPRCFRTLLRLLGIEAALASLIELVNAE